MSRIRQREIHTRRVRREQLKKLRLRHAEAKTSTQKEQVVAKLGKIAPWLSLKELLGK